jgi:hypothetical protein
MHGAVVGAFLTGGLLLAVAPGQDSAGCRSPGAAEDRPAVQAPLRQPVVLDVVVRRGSLYEPGVVQVEVNEIWHDGRPPESLVAVFRLVGGQSPQGLAWAGARHEKRVAMSLDDRAVIEWDDTWGFQPFDMVLEMRFVDQAGVEGPPALIRAHGEMVMFGWLGWATIVLAVLAVIVAAIIVRPRRELHFENAVGE